MGQPAGQQAVADYQGYSNVSLPSSKQVYSADLTAVEFSQHTTELLSVLRKLFCLL